MNTRISQTAMKTINQGNGIETNMVGQRRCGYYFKKKGVPVS